MLRQAVAQGLIHRLEGISDVRVFYEGDYSKAEGLINPNAADIALIEVAETGVYDVLYCLDLCTRLRKTIPSCKLILLCPEQDEADVSAIVEAKQKGNIEDFIFYDASLDYLVFKLIST